MPAITDPRLDLVPDFANDPIEAPEIEAWVNRGLTQQEAVDQLIAVWEQKRARRIEAWDAAQANQQNLNGPQARNNENGDAPPPPGDNQQARPPVAPPPPPVDIVAPRPVMEAKTKSKPAFKDSKVLKGHAVDSKIEHAVCAYALERLGKGEYVELEYFTKKRRLEAFFSRRGGSTDPVTISADGATVKVQTGSSKPLKDIVPDHLLSFADFQTAQPVLLKSMTDLKYPEDQVESLATLFYWCSVTNTRFEPCGEAAILQYVALVRPLWHESLSNEECFDIGVVNKDKVDEIRGELVEKDRVKRFDA